MTTTKMHPRKLLQHLRQWISLRGIFLCMICGVCFAYWVFRGTQESWIHADFARDLSEMSNLWIHRIVWLGPQLRAGFPASPIYYYLLFPGLILSGGSAYSLIITHALTATLALLAFAWALRRQHRGEILLGVLTLAFSPWWVTIATQPWNGNFYVGFVALGMLSLWIRTPFFLSALLLGTAIAIHPAAVLVLPVLLFEWVTRTNKIRHTVGVVAGLLIPWIPIIVFEGITKGFLTRQWLANPSSGFSLSFGVSNLLQLAEMIQIPWLICLLIWIAAFVVAKGKLRFWLVSLMIPLLFLTTVSTLHFYYLFGLLCAIVLSLLLIYIPTKVGKMGICVILIFYGVKLAQVDFRQPARSIDRIEHRVSTFIEQSNLDPTKSYALVSVIDESNSTPQADDYRFFLRTKGYKAVNIPEYPTADRLVLFLEVENFQWQEWTDWHMEYFGKRKVFSVVTIDGKDIVIFERE